MEKLTAEIIRKEFPNAVPDRPDYIGPGSYCVLGAVVMFMERHDPVSAECQIITNRTFPRVLSALGWLRELAPQHDDLALMDYAHRIVDANDYKLDIDLAWSIVAEMLEAPGVMAA